MRYLTSFSFNFDSIGGHLWSSELYAMNTISAFSIVLLVFAGCVHSGPVSTHAKQEVGGIECDVCEALVKVLEGYAEDNKTESEVKQDIEKFCGDLPGSIGDICKTFVTEDFDEIWEDVINDLTPDQVCAEIGVCDSKKLPKKIYLPRRKQQPKGAVECDVCEEVVKIAEQYAQQNQSEEEVKEEIEKVCMSLPSSISTICKDLVDQYFDEIWQDIIGDLTPDQVCTQIGLCGSKKLLKKVLKKVSVPTRKQQPKQTPACDYCKLVTTFLKPYVDSNSTEEDVKNALDQLCAALPSTISPECKTFVGTYFTIIWTLLEAEIDGDAICVQLGLCPSLEQPQQSIECQICQLVVNYVKIFVDQNASKEEVEDGLEKLCGFLPSSVTAECNSTVVEYFPIIWVLLKSEVDSGELCKLINVCKAASVDVKAIPSKQPDQTVECDVCTLVVSYAKPYVDENATETEVKDALEKVCSILPSTYSATCTQLINDNFDAIWILLKGEVDSGQICVLIGLCTSDKPSMKDSLPEEETECDYCKLVANLAAIYIADSSVSKDDAKDLLTAACNALPSDDQQMCKTMVTEYFDMIWENLQNEVDSSKICYQLGVCTGLAAVSEVNKVQSNESCAICKMAVEVLKPFVDSSVDKADVKEAIEFVCSILPGNSSSECSGFVKEYFSLVWTLMKAEVDGGEICELLELCSKSTVPLSRPEAPEAGVLCALCEYVLKEIEQRLPVNATEQDILKLVSGICDVMPSTVESECKMFVKKYGPEIIDQLINNVAPNAVCAVLQLCTVSVAHSNGACGWGPVYWCSSPATIIECNAADYCKGVNVL